MVSTITTLAIPYSIGYYTSGLETATIQLVILGGSIFLMLEAQEVCIGWLRQQVRERFFQQEFWYLPQQLSRQYFARPLSYLTEENSEIDGAGVESLRDKIWSTFVSYIYTIIPGYTYITLGVGACLYIHPFLGMIAFTYTLIELKLAQVNNREIHQRMRPIIDEFKRWERRMNEWWHNIDHVKCQGVETRVITQIHDEVQNAIVGDDAVWRIYHAKWLVLRRSISLVFAGLMYSTLAYLVLTEITDLTGVILIIFTFQLVRKRLEEISDQQREVGHNLASIAKYRSVLEPPTPFVYNEGIEFADPTISISFAHVSLTVPDGDRRKPILRDVHLTIKSGERIGIIGPSGAGKSQLVKLIVRSTDPDKGTVKINTHDLRTLKLETYLRYCSVIMQKSEPFEDTVLGNLMFGVSHLDALHKVSIEELERRAWHALKKAGLELGTSLHEGIYTNIGFKGMRLSGGQQQRLQIAAAHFKLMEGEKCRPRLILADEPTSALDSLSESAVMSHLHESLPEGTTLLMVAHRLATVANMERIIFVRPLSACEADCVQVTSHSHLYDLYEQEPLFRKMADAQGFRP